jgi:MarR family transcriptional regulator for hemolysin
MNMAEKRREAGKEKSGSSRSAEGRKPAGQPVPSGKAFADKRPEDLLDNTIFLIMDIGRLYRAIFDTKMERMGLTRAEWWLLAHLCYFDGSTQQELCDIMDIDKGGMAKLISKLEDKGLIRRESDSADARQKRIYFTAGALPLATMVDQASVQTGSASVAALKQAEVATLHRLLRTLRESLLSERRNSAFLSRTARPGE